MSIRDRLLAFEERLQRLAGEPVPREPLEVRQAVLHGIVDLTRPAGRGRRVLPYDHVEVQVLAPGPELRRVFDAVFARDGGLEAAARAALVDAACDGASRLGVSVRYRRKPPREWAPEQVVALLPRLDETAPAPGPSRTREAGPGSAGATPPGTVQPSSTLTAEGHVPGVVLKVLAGRAASRKLEVRSARINVGRGAEVSDRDGRLVRRNHLAFTEGDEVSSTVSRAHAHLRYDAAGGAFRLRDDHSAYGTRLVRGGQTVEVAAGPARGVKLQHGDELHFGRAVVLFELARNPGGPHSRNALSGGGA